MRIDVLTLFPGMFPSYLGESLLSKAIERGLVEIHLHDIRQWSRDKHQKVDDRPYGGGPGMVLRVEPVVECVEDVQRMAAAGRLIMLSPQGQKLHQKLVEQLAELPRLVLLCGRYEGFDQRVVDILQPQEISIGDYVLNGGEAAAMVIIDAVIRLLPGVLGDEESSRCDSFSHDYGWLESAQYTRPREYRGHQVPEILLSGNHEEIAAWRKKQRYHRTAERRGDLLEQSTNEDSTNEDSTNEDSTNEDTIPTNNNERSQRSANTSAQVNERNEPQHEKDDKP